MGQPAARGKFYHLFINGHYWGVFNTCERIKASYGASYLGGKEEENYDAIKKGRTYLEDRKMSVGVMANGNSVHGDGSAISRAKASSPTRPTSRCLAKTQTVLRNLDYEGLLEVDGTIDYMLVIFYGGNYDAPVSAWEQSFGPNNWYGLRHAKTGMASASSYGTPSTRFAMSARIAAAHSRPATTTRAATHSGSGSNASTTKSFVFAWAIASRNIFTTAVCSPRKKCWNSSRSGSMKLRCPLFASPPDGVTQATRPPVAGPRPNDGLARTRR